MSRTKPELGPKDKTLASHGFGYDFHVTNPQRHVPCKIGSMLAPASADDIPPIPPAAAESVRRAFELLEQLLGDRDHNLYFGNADRDGEATREAEAIRRIRGGVLAILRTSAWVPCGKTLREYREATNHSMKPGVVLHMASGETHLVGDVNILAGLCDDCSLNSHEIIEATLDLSAVLS